MSNVLMDISLHVETQRRAVDLSSYQFIREILTPQNLPNLKQSFGEMSGEDSVDCYPQSDASD